MYSENKEDILDRMLVNSKTSSTEGTLIYDALSPVSNELEKIKNNLDEVLSKAFAKTAFENNFSNFLELKANEHGIFRKLGKRATGVIKVEGVKGSEIRGNTLVQTNLGLQYSTLEDSKINENGVVEVKVIALKEGTSYNVAANLINELPIKLVGINKIYNEKPFENGRDTESDESLYNRLCIKVKTPSTSGNIYDYMNWALEVNGVGNCIIKPLWNGNGTVKVILVNNSGRCPSKEIIQNVFDNIEKKRPIGSSVTVVGVEEFKINVSCKLLLEPNSNTEDIKKLIIKNIETYLKKIALKDTKLRFNRIANCILDVENVIDYSELKINNSNTDITLKSDNIAVLESVVVDSET